MPPRLCELASCRISSSWFHLGRKQVGAVGGPCCCPLQPCPRLQSPKFTLLVDQQTINRVLFGTTINGRTFGTTLNGSGTIVGNTRTGRSVPADAVIMGGMDE